MDNRTKKTNNKRFVRYPEGAEMYSMSLSKFQQLAKDAKACYKMNRLVLVNEGVPLSVYNWSFMEVRQFK